MNTMNRCLPMPIVRFSGMLILALCGFAVSDPAAAQLGPRQFPPAAKRGLLVVTAPPEVLINGTSEQLSPGARIKGTNNLMVMSGSLAGASVLVNYVRNTQGQIHEVWILSDEEAQEKRSGLETITNYVFESGTSSTQK